MGNDTITFFRADGRYGVSVNHTPIMASTSDFSAALRVFSGEVAKNALRPTFARADIRGWDGDAGKDFALDPNLAFGFEYPR